ncbi:MAG: hypothetical protein ACK40T_11240 [Akkermansiaceae bacterium]|jgi:hypothetical protein
MKFFITFIILTVFCFAEQDTATVRFMNGDQLSGNAISLNLDTLTWHSDLLTNQAHFKLNQIKDLELPSKINESAQNAGHQAVLELTNGDSVKGMLVGLNDKEIRLKTWFAGEMVFSRFNVKSVDITRASKIIYRGPTGIDDWKVLGDEKSWVYANSEFTSKATGAIARNFDFPDEMEIGYNLAWKGIFKSKVILFTSDITTPNPQSGYEIYIQGSSTRIRRLSDSNYLRIIANPSRMQPTENARIEIRMSQRTKKIHIFINDVLQSTFLDDEMNKMKGKGLTFTSDPNYETKLSEIQISEWDGNVDESNDDEAEFRELGFNRMNFHRGMPVQPQKPKELKDGRMMLANGDTLEGEVLGIDNEMIKIKTPFTEVIFPVHRIKNLALKKSDYSEAIRRKGDVRGHLADGSILVFELKDVIDGKIIGLSQNFGNAQFDQSAFKRIEFNIYPKYK